VRVVLDTNVVASALLWGGTPERLIELAGDGRLELFTSEALLAELSGILGRPKFAAKLRQA
jgi:putative PIN family toxin of toxin-antitoxin system